MKVLHERIHASRVLYEIMNQTKEKKPLFPKYVRKWRETVIVTMEVEIEFETGTHCCKIQFQKLNFRLLLYLYENAQQKIT